MSQSETENSISEVINVDKSAEPSSDVAITEKNLVNKDESTGTKTDSKHADKTFVEIEAPVDADSSSSNVKTESDVESSKTSESSTSTDVATSSTASEAESHNSTSTNSSESDSEASNVTGVFESRQLVSGSALTAAMMVGAPLLAGALFAGASAPEHAVQDFEQGIAGPLQEAFSDGQRGEYGSDSGGWGS